MWQISDFIMEVWTAQIHFCFFYQAQATFICGPKSDTYTLFCNATSVWMAMSHFMWFLHHWNATDVIILCWRRQEDSNNNGRQYIDNNITSSFRLRLHINLKIAKQTLTWAASIFISANTVRCVWCHIFFCACWSLQDHLRFTHETDGSRI